MKNTNLSLSNTNTKVYGFAITLTVFFLLFLSRNDTMDGIMTLKIHLAYGLYFCLALFSLWALIKSKNPSYLLWLIGMAACGYFLYPFAVKYFPLSGLNDAALLWVGAISSILLWTGIHLATKKDFTAMFGCSFMSLGIVMINFYILRWMFGADYQIPTDGGSYVALFICCMFCWALGFGWTAIWKIAEGRIGVKIVAIVYMLVWVGSFWINLIALNNVWFGGCFPNTPIGQKCGLPTSRNMMPIAVIDTPIAPPAKEDTAANNPLVYAYTEVVMPKGGSLCGTLGMTPMEAKAFGKANHLRISYKGHKLFVLVKPGWIFRNPGNGTWVLVKK
ncbi:MAG: hypothetical protein KA052_02055 [Candidatus Pacebacteria bacterium]|nr:hypothetical protein [Candidatus Paceibacterota bacterium]